MGTLCHDMRITCRNLAKQPGFTLTTAGILAIGVAGLTTVFSLFNGLFLRPCPVPNADRLMMLYETDRKTATQFVGAAYPRFHAWRQHNGTFERMGFSSFFAANLSMDDRTERVSLRLASHDFLEVLGLRPIVGRYFTAEEDRQGGPNVVLLSFGLWERLFGRDPAVVGRMVRLDNEPFTVIGVLPREADFPEEKDLWQPLRPDALGRHGGLGTWAMGRLKEGVTVEQAREDLVRIHQGWIEQYAENEVTTRPAVVPFREFYRQQINQFRFGLFILLGVMGFALLAACCNVTSIMLARGTFQIRGFALRAALGASRGRIIGQVLAESLILSVLGGALGVLLGHLALDVLLSSQLANQVPRWITFSMDARCVLFAVEIVTASTVASGLLPSLHAAFARDVHGVLQAAATRSCWRTLHAIVTGEVALAMTVLIGAGLLLRTFRQVQSIDPGFRHAGILTYNISLPIGPYFDEAKRRAFWEQHLEKVRALPGVTQAAMSNYLPMSWPSFDHLEIEDAVLTDGGQSPPAVLCQRVTPGYFETLSIRLLAGRLFADEDNRKDSEPVAIINETLAEQFWPGESPLDKRVRRPNSSHWVRVVAVVGDVINSALDQPPWPAVYLPTGPDVPFGMFGIVQASDDPLAPMASIRQVVRSADAGLPIQNVQTMSQRVAESMWLRRLVAWLFGIPAVAAAIMACAGLYGVISYSVSQRVQEIGIRMALGASRPDVIRMVARQALRLILIGLAFGGVGGFVLGRLFASLPGMLHNVSPDDPVTYLGVMLLLTAVALLACYLPARRAARTDPMAALRCE